MIMHANKTFNPIVYTKDFLEKGQSFLRIFSDLHLEFDDSFSIPNLLPDQIVVLAGDIHKKWNAIPFIEKILAQGNHVVYVNGNHEFYNTKIYKVVRAFTELALKHANFHFLNNSSVFINDIEFLGGTLWTDMNNQDPHTYWELGSLRFDRENPNGLKDYIKIHHKRWDSDLQKHIYNLIKTKDTVRFHKDTVRYIKSRINQHTKQVVVTHHTPSLKFIDTKRFSKSQIANYGYYSELDHLVRHFDVWIAAHTHKKVYERIDDADSTLLISNPRGYHGTDDLKDQVNEFDPHLITTI